MGHRSRRECCMHRRVSITPDGRSIVYSADVDGVPHLFIASVDGTGQRQITRGDGETQPSCSPDGTRIVYTSLRKAGSG